MKFYFYSNQFNHWPDNTMSFFTTISIDLMKYPIEKINNTINNHHNN